ncbi:MAG: hypothetical protein SFZ03_05140 [Candidatus Melainabacteria bacterium]|nr:hypothetical protein [Candidatus Melainabacteria bacterium]
MTLSFVPFGSPRNHDVQAAAPHANALRLRFLGQTAANNPEPEADTLQLERHKQWHKLLHKAFTEVLEMNDTEESLVLLGVLKGAWTHLLLERGDRESLKRLIERLVDHPDNATAPDTFQQDHGRVREFLRQRRLDQQKMWPAFQQLWQQWQAVPPPSRETARWLPYQFDTQLPEGLGEQAWLQTMTNTLEAQLQERLIPREATDKDVIDLLHLLQGWRPDKIPPKVETALNQRLLSFYLTELEEDYRPIHESLQHPPTDAALLFQGVLLLSGVELPGRYAAYRPEVATRYRWFQPYVQAKVLPLSNPVQAIRQDLEDQLAHKLAQDLDKACQSEKQAKHNQLGLKKHKLPQSSNTERGALNALLHYVSQSEKEPALHHLNDKLCAVLCRYLDERLLDTQLETVASAPAESTRLKQDALPLARLVLNQLSNQPHRFHEALDHRLLRLMQALPQALYPAEIQEGYRRRFWFRPEDNT